MTKNKTLLVTNALPYANGPIHLGHMLEHIQSDIFVRFNRAIGNKVFYVCGDDCHGTPVMIKAGQMGITPEQMIEITSKDHAEDLKGFLVNYDNYYRTHSKENHEISSYMYEKAKENGYIKTETISQLYDPEKNMFFLSILFWEAPHSPFYSLPDWHTIFQSSHYQSSFCRRSYLS